ncbi:thyroid adenoma-associated protein homolog [Hyposmocoma kahamanoa]|uniref:thyroid adenoma-associated protein homolog n=1 Tax=Hyposmocoma kahamanoa TaxID=1477025 RepID=UPI000E6D8B54|nr:thyroid adenoma-associated protein homolog [Hyposmocoma kahamanoa]
MRYITKNVSLQPSFSSTLATQIKFSIDHKHEYKKYIEVVSKIAICIENFPAGTMAVKMLEVLLMEYLQKCLQCCVVVLRITKTLSPTEKNEIFNLAHSALRLLLYIVQKVNSPSELNHIFEDVRVCLKGLMFDDDVPMDTKSLCGILYLNMQLLENGANSWMDILERQPNDDNINSLLSNEASQLSLFSAIATVIPMDLLRHGNIQGEVPIIVLCKKILDIGERSSSESIFILGVTRTLQQISKHLCNVTDTDAGLMLVEHLLTFVWAYLEHYMDSVRHLTSQILGNIVRYCARLKREGEAKALSNLFSKLSSLDKTRKSYYLSLTSLVNELGAVAIIEALPNVIVDVIQALNVQAVQASATTTLETLLQSHAPHSDTQTIYVQWIEPILSYVSSNSSDSGVLNILENLLAKAVRLDENVMTYIMPYIKRCATSSHDLKCILMLLNVTRKSGVTGNFSVADNDTEWKGVIGYDVLDLAAVDACEETRILSLSLIVESPKSTEIFTREELNFVLNYLKYNINAQAPNLRQLTLSMMKKFIKRLEDSYKHHLKQSSENYYILFVERLRAFCFECLTPGANYSRRFVALQVLSWCEAFSFYGYSRTWKPVYIEKLLLHLEDSYENNKALALEILGKCPTDILQNNTYSMCLLLKDIIKQASALKPTECISASYKLSLLVNKLPDHILQGEKNTTPELVYLVVLRHLQSVLRTELEICQASVINACAKAPMYGVLHCMRRIVTSFDADAISTDQEWREMIDDIIEDCISVNAAVACVVNNSSPEGHLPMDMSGVNAHLHEGGVRLEDGRQVTAQMVLLCAWRSVKEVSLLLGEMSSRLTIAGEKHPEGTLSARQMLTIGEHFTKLLAETKHRGAFEQAYVGFTKLLTRLWRCRSPELHELPRTWLNDLMLAIASGEKKGTLCATRRSAGLPFMIQALVTTELQIQGNPKCFHQCMTTLLRLARNTPQPIPDSETAIETRTHAINILRALFRNSMLEESVSGYVGEGLLVALLGFEGSTWMERNSSTLLFSALMVRIFGVQRSRDTENLSTRNRMTGRIFFLRYPMLYDFMLEKLNEVSSSDDTQILRPSLYPILLLLARLYPSALEGTVSNLKLVAYIPHVLACAKSSVLKTRQLAAKALVPLISPEQYVTHLETMIDLISEKNIKRNYCHGILLQLLKLLDAKPHDLLIDEQSEHRLENKIAQTTWILEQATRNMPCYLLAEEYVKVINLVIWSSSDNNDETRGVVVTFLELNFNSLFKMNLDGLSEEDQFEYKSTLFATLITTLEDDDSSLRQRTSNTITQASVVSSRAAEVLRNMVDDDGVFVVLALLDFRSEVCINDDGNDECRVFDQNERYNIYLEETIWTNECARQIKERNKSNHNIVDYVLKIIHNHIYERTLQKLCGRNVILFEKMCNNQTINRVDIMNPKIRLFVNCLHSFQ